MAHANQKILPLSGLLLALAGCGGGEPLPGGAAPDIASADGVAVDAGVIAEPTFHRLPLAQAEPDDIDADGLAASAFRAATAADDPAELQGLDTRALTDDRVVAWRAGSRAHALAARPLATTGAVVYTPAQIRAAYRLPALPASGATVDATTAASLGAGQTIFVVAANHHPNAAADLAAFNAKFGLPTCGTTTIPAGSTGLAPAKASAGCTFAVAFAAAGATVGRSAPAYDAAWAQEIALDVQWAHAIAPLARIVLVEAAGAGVSTLANAVALANRLGPGVVTMSFGAPEGSWVGGTASSFQAAGMSYLAATGDSGAAVSWPAAMAQVTAVGGTTLAVSAGGTRSERAWARTGGGVSAFVGVPAYQAPLKVGGGTRYRAVADVAFNADPASGQYVAFTAAGTSSPKWFAFGGTSLSTPQWAGLVAVANAQRALAGLAPLGGNANALLYGRFAPGSAAWAGAFGDVSAGRNGSCALCTARGGYDVPTGLGTPNATALLAGLAQR